MHYRTELRKLEKKHQRHFPTLAQAMGYDKVNISFKHLKKENEKRKAK